MNSPLYTSLWMLWLFLSYLLFWGVQGVPMLVALIIFALVWVSLALAIVHIFLFPDCLDRN